MESRGKLAKRLVKLIPDEVVASGSNVVANGKTVGSVTSTAVGPNGPVALAYVKTAALDNGSELMVEETAVALS